MKLLRFGWGLCALLACGGRVEAPPDGSGSGADDPTPTTPSAGKAGTSDVPTYGLPECKPGFSRSDSSRSCDWASPSGVCYATKSDACACVCPRDRDSVCVSGFFDGPGNATKVSCD